jgi:alpha-beta hydrolase superfamily lysophospholipase
MTDSILDYLLVSTRYFFPRKVDFSDPFWVESGETRLSCFHSNNHPGSKTVIFFHGNGEVVSDYIELYIPLFNQMGLNCLLAEYRGYSMSTGIPGLVSMLSDVSPIIRSTGIDPRNIVLFGRSIGSFYALHGVSLFPDIGGLIIESGVADVCERLLLRISPQELGLSMKELELEVQKHFNHQEKLHSYKGSTLVMHATGDSLVDKTHGERLFHWAPEPKDLKLFEKGDHNDIFYTNSQEYVDTLCHFLAKIWS